MRHNLTHSCDLTHSCVKYLIHMQHDSFGSVPMTTLIQWIYTLYIGMQHMPHTSFYMDISFYATHAAHLDIFTCICSTCHTSGIFLDTQHMPHILHLCTWICGTYHICCIHMRHMPHMLHLSKWICLFTYICGTCHTCGIFVHEHAAHATHVAHICGTCLT